MLPLVSVIVPAFNAARYLADAVESVFAQTYPAVECVVIDDGSTDNTRDILNALLRKHPELKTARKANGGLSSARNLGLRECTGDLISFLDADDVLLPDKLERQVAFLNAHPEIDIVYGDCLISTETRQPIAMYKAEMPRELEPIDALCYRNWFGAMIPLLRRTITDRVGEFDEKLAAAEDWDYWIRCAGVARMFHLAGAVSLYRQHPGQMHQDYFRMRRACIQVAVQRFGDDPGKLRKAKAAIQWTHAKYLWSQRKVISTALALAKLAAIGGFGNQVWYITGPLERFVKLQLKPL